MRDKFGENFGSGSGLAPDPKTWSRADGAYRGTIYMLPDRGYNISGTENYRARLNKLTVVLRPPTDPKALPPEASQHTLEMTLADTTPLRDANITQSGYHAGVAYKDPSGVDVDIMVLVYRVTLPN